MRLNSELEYVINRLSHMLIMGFWVDTSGDNQNKHFSLKRREIISNHCIYSATKEGSDKPG